MQARIISMTVFLLLSENCVWAQEKQLNEPIYVTKVQGTTLLIKFPKDIVVFYNQKEYPSLSFI